jgi:hypothetical protein
MSGIFATQTPSEFSYRRGVHQAFAEAGRLVGMASSLEEARRLLGLAEDEAQDFRHGKRQPTGTRTLIDDIHEAALKGASSSR